jgi:Retroviral aspartyl protease
VKLTSTIACPEQEDSKDLCLTGYITIKGVKAYTLFDSGSTTDTVSPDFARVSNVPIQKLEKPATLQLRCLGSRSKINFATTMVVKLGLITMKSYIDKYDCILGTQFFRRHSISLDFEFQDIVIHGKLHIPTFPEGEGMSVMKPI